MGGIKMHTQIHLRETQANRTSVQATQTKLTADYFFGENENATKIQIGWAAHRKPSTDRNSY
jgi:hypothetical protein